MIGNDPNGYIRFFIAAVCSSGFFSNPLDGWLKNIGIIVRCFPLDGRHQPFKAHSCVNMFLRQVFECAVCHTIVLDKNQVPYLYDLWVVFIDQITAGDFIYFRLRS